MGNSEEKFHKRRLRSSYLSVVVSITLVLFMLGVFGTLLLQADDLARHVRENFTFEVLLQEDASEADVRQFQKELELSEQVVSTEFISKEEAAASFQEELGEEFVDFLGYNPLSDVIEIRMSAEYVNAESIEAFESNLSDRGIVQEVVYDRNLVELVNENIRRIGMILLGAALLLIIVSIALINSSIRLSIYSRRFTIKTMQLVGATKLFIQKPFMAQSARLGLISGVIASSLLGIILWFGRDQLLTVGIEFQPEIFAMIVGGMLVFGSFLAWSCTFIAVNRYLKLKTDQLYF